MAFEEQQSTSGASTGIMLNSRIEIFPSTALPDLNSPGGAAFAARFKADASSSLFAIVNQSRTLPRIESVQPMRNIDNPGVLRLADAGVIQWIDGAFTYALVYQKPTAPRLFATLEDTHPPLGEDAINRHFVAPMIGALTALSNAGIAHNQIRPTNIFWRSGTAVPPQLGECLSVPAGVGQPALFEPIARAQASPLGRGVGTSADDCYSFGVSLAFLVLGRNPLAGLDERAIIDLKMQRGSFGAIIGNHRLLPSHIEILRGLLADDAEQRWTPGDLDMWLNGRRSTPKSSDAGKRAGRQFVFMGKEYWQVGPLAEALAANPPEAAKAIENESVNKWLRRALNDKDCAKDLEDTVDELKQSGKTAHYEDQLVARACIALDHQAPIRYRGLAVMPMGIPTMFIDAIQNGTNLQPLSEMIVSQVVSLWFRMQTDAKTDYVSWIQLFERIKSVLEKASYGNGVERALYESNPGLPCFSPIIRSQFVTSPKALLPALELAAAQSGKSREPMDRHIAAFLIVRERRSETSFSALNLPEDSTDRGLALLRLYADLQNKYGPENLPHLASWLSWIVDPALKRFFGKSTREAMQKRAKECIASGNLAHLLTIVDEPYRLEHDRRDFYAARLLYLNIQKEILSLETRNHNREDIARNAGKPIAVSISSLLAVILACAAVVRVLFKALFG